MEIIGRQIELGVGAESSRGVPLASPAKWFRKAEATIVEKAVHAVDETSFGGFEDGEGRRVVQSYIEGEVSGPLHADAIGWFFGNIYGICVTTTVTGDVRDHVFNLKQNANHASLTFFAKDGAVQNLAFAGCMVDTLQLSVTTEDYIRFTAKITGNTATTDTETTTETAEYDFVSRDVTIKMAATLGGLPAADAVPAKTVDITWDQGLIRDHVVGQYNPDDIYNSRLMIEGNFTLNFADTTLKTLYQNDQARYMEIKIQGAADIGTGNNPTITILLHKVQIMEWDRQGGGSDLVTQPIRFRAFRSRTDAKQSQVTLRNLTAAYTNIPTS
jgi:hypothetical protein